MKALAALALLVGAGLVAGTATGDPIPIPPVPTVTVSLPPPPVPLPVAPAAPEPAVPAAVSEPAASAVSQVSQTAASTSSSGGSLVGSSAGSNLSGSSSDSDSGFGSSGTTSGSTGRARVDHLHSSRPWIATTGSKKRRTTTFTFVLRRSARVIFTIQQVSPACVGIGHFGVAGHAGLNRVRFAGRVHGRQLEPGTYRIAARTAAGRLVRRITLVVVSGSAPTPAELTALRAANACGAAAAQTGTGGTSAAPLPGQELPKPSTEKAAGITPQAPNLHTGVLGSAVQKTARAIKPLLVALLALAILLLAVASLPRFAVADPRVNELLARHRIEIAALGAAALVAVALAFLLA